MAVKKFFSSESVTEGHPDKVCDQISDAVLDALIAKDPYARVACETCATTGIVFVMGEITTENAYVDIQSVVREKVLEIGYNDSAMGFDGASCAVLTAINEQSPDIAMGVDAALETRTEKNHDIGAGDQGMMFGFACNQTPQLMPLPIMLSHEMCKKLAEVRKTGLLPYLRPDGKGMITVEYEDDKPVRVDSVVLSAQHNEDASLEQLTEDLKREVIMKTGTANWIDDNTKILINPTGRFCTGGPKGDSGLTGRKLVVDTYGGWCAHGGGAFSGKDPTKVDRSAAYAARYVAKNIVAAGLADSCEVMISYAIGVAKPVAIQIDCRGTEKVSIDKITKAVEKSFDLRPAAIIDTLGLRRPIYSPTASYGHFGRDEFPWEAVDRAELLTKNL